MRLEMRDLAQCVHAGVGAARAVHGDFFLRDLLERVVQRALDRRQCQVGIASRGSPQPS